METNKQGTVAFQETTVTGKSKKLMKYGRDWTKVINEGKFPMK
jgi:hypothetical protein